MQFTQKLEAKQYATFQRTYTTLHKGKEAKKRMFKLTGRMSMSHIPTLVVTT